jgi:hypothetical protein
MGAAIGSAQTAPIMTELPQQHLATPISTTGTSPTNGARVVVSGESLWSIASAALTKQLGATPSLVDVDVYWRAVVTMNVPGLRSGDADLIYPGETVILPDFDRP